MPKCKKRIAVIVCICFVLASILSGAFVALHSDHECSGEQCEICLQISHITNTLKQLRAAVLLVAVSLAAISATLIAVSDNKAVDFATPISLKVKMNN